MSEGKVIIYYENENKLYERNLKDGIFEGKGIQYYENGNKKYEVNFKNSNPIGKGNFYDKNGKKINKEKLTKKKK